MSEYDKFMDTIKNKSDSTKKQYRLQYNKLFKLTGKPIEETSEKKIIELLDEIDNKIIKYFFYIWLIIRYKSYIRWMESIIETSIISYIMCI